MSDACDRCGGKGIVPKVPGDWRVTIPCKSCGGNGRRGTHPESNERRPRPW